MRLETREGMTVLALLRADARNWWANDTEAKVRRSVRSSARRLREARDSGGFLTIGRGGCTVHSTQYRPDGKVRSTTRAGCHSGDALAAKRLLPWIDTTTAPNSTIVHVAVRLPMIVPDVRATERDMLFPAPGKEPGPLDHVPFLEYRALAEPYGVTFGNLHMVPGGAS